MSAVCGPHLQTSAEEEISNPFAAVVLAGREEELRATGGEERSIGVEGRRGSTATTTDVEEEMEKRSQRRTSEDSIVNNSRGLILRFCEENESNDELR
ncbi:hypothetical protein QVD17_02494 [Tagetes erecta]|uniref:Uncharacterized protein n=1 Tax=Tagetes erecta TaxID=13708 RepID=A0AAD8P959_TARER|nr:hypothetical protein QVD17_02494 [Tagetes erecta]